MQNALIIIAAVILLGGLLYFEKKGDIRTAFLTKTPLSLLFVLAVLVQPHPLPGYYYCLLIGLILCLIGDVFLALPQKIMFPLGLISFLFGHVFYIFAFIHVAEVSEWFSFESLIIFIISGWIYFRLRPHLEKMMIPVLLYIIVITIMFCGAWAVFGTKGWNFAGTSALVLGAVCFYLSDIFVARDRFIQKEFLNQLIGLPLYYAGQFLLAFSVGLLR